MAGYAAATKRYVASRSLAGASTGATVGPALRSGLRDRTETTRRRVEVDARRTESFEVALARIDGPAPTRTNRNSRGETN